MLKCGLKVTLPQIPLRKIPCGQKIMFLFIEYCGAETLFDVLRNICGTVFKS